MRSAKKVGCLTQVNQILVSGAPSSVFTLQHWSSSEQSSGSSTPPGAISHPAGAANRKRDDFMSVRPRHGRRHSRYLSVARQNQARELLLKAQEGALNFLVRWCLLDNAYRLPGVSLRSDYQTPRQVKPAANLATRSSGSQLAATKPLKTNLSQLVAKHHDRLITTTAAARRKPLNHSRLLLEDVHRLRQRNLRTFARYFFWRWLTWVNIIELLLIILMFSLCAYQCYELLEDYYNYPAHVIVNNVLNDDFRTDLPALTLCDNNRVSKQRLKEEFPELNETHFLAMTHGRFYSATNFTLTLNGSDGDLVNTLLETWYSNEANSMGVSANHTNSQPGSNITGVHLIHHPHESPHSADPTLHHLERVWHPLGEQDINWIMVGRTLTNFSPAGHYRIVPNKSFVDSLICATISGDRIPCDKILTVSSIQDASGCHTYFHDSVLWDPSDPRVAELERHLRTKPIKLSYGTQGDEDPTGLLEFDPEIELREQLEEELEEANNEERIRIEMENKEIVRMRVNFNGQDYANPRELVGGKLAVHSSSTVGEITHKSYEIEPGNWYIYYIERSDHQRLPPPYNTNCFDYDSNRLVWQRRRETISERAIENGQLIRRQANSTKRLLPEYANFLRSRTMGKRECIKMCLSELSSSKCGCWNQGVPYVRQLDSNTSNVVDERGELAWCRLQRLQEMQKQQNKTSKTTGDDLFFQVCSMDYTPLCVAACPDECFYSSFEVIQQSRSWPSHESQRYSENKYIWQRLRQEAECCATISIIYTSPASTSLQTEPKYTRQDMVTIISGNIEAWLGISAVHAYFFFEHLYEALFGARGPTTGR